MSKAFVTVFRGDVGGSAQSVANTTWATVLFDIINTDGANTSMYAAATGTFTIPISGWYDIEAEISWASSAVGNTRSVRIIRQDPAFPIKVSEYPTSTTGPFTTSIRTRATFSQGETLQIQGYQDSGGPLAISATLDPGTEGQPGHGTNAMITLVKESPGSISLF